jgi:hypothetical protein
MLIVQVMWLLVVLVMEDTLVDAGMEAVMMKMPIKHNTFSLHGSLLALMMLAIIVPLPE